MPEVSGPRLQGGAGDYPGSMSSLPQPDARGRLFGKTLFQRAAFLSSIRQQAAFNELPFNNEPPSTTTANHCLRHYNRSTSRHLLNKPVRRHFNPDIDKFACLLF
ncbi:hypothetical protein Y032_0005g2682 [Ancylostoma ceylanicum]|uniref:Uncharacterized protein n=1 Tax=Ancylostoma ceylanicum TaxID=53326 RepID=A0A016VSG8_9BILA|nr:hypothetical protein Y032_0005g2682 [Ancylostoma ceylanicum]